MSYFLHMRTFSGLDLNLLEFKPEDVRIEDIAHHLAFVNRFGGATRYPIAVAQHAVYCGRIVFERARNQGWVFDSASEAALYALHHDSGEAYVGDVIKWLKDHPQMWWFRELEDQIQSAIHNALGLQTQPPPAIAKLVDWADRVMVRFEGLHKKGCAREFIVMGGEQSDNERRQHKNYPDLTAEELAFIGKWQPWTWRVAEENFLVHHRMYSRNTQ